MKPIETTRNSKGRRRTEVGVRFGGAKCHLFLVGQGTWRRWTDKSINLKRCVLQSGEEVRRCFVKSPKDSVWVTRSTSQLASLAKDSIQGSGDRRLLVLSPIDEVTHHVLAAWFRYVVVGMDNISLLGPTELFEVLQAPNRDELFIGGAFDFKRKLIVLYRGSVQPLVVPLSWFKNTADRDPEKLQIIDYGQTVKLGNFEAAADAILYEFDDKYRRRAKRRIIETDTSLGGSIRRLRLQRGLRRGDFGRVPARTIARIEHGEVRKPHRHTLDKIATRLGVPAVSLGSY